MDPDKRFLSRKWSLTVGVVLIACAARGLAWIDGAQFVSLLTWIVGLYMVGDVGTAAVDKLTVSGSKSA